MQKPKDVDDYIAAQPADIAKRLASIRKIVRENAPQVTEKISYGMPYYSLNGRLLYFMAHTHHIGFYPMRSAINKLPMNLLSTKLQKAQFGFLMISR